MKIAVIGCGYVGLVTGACLADLGHDVSCVDYDHAKVTALQNGEIPIHEPGLDILVARNSIDERLRFTSELRLAVSEAEIVFIAVGTPSRRGDGHADLSYVYAAAKDLAPLLRDFTVVATKSTVPVGTGDEVERIIREENPTAEMVVVSNPEFLREGVAINDFTHPDRIVIGCEDGRAQAAMRQVYRSLDLNEARLMFTDRRTAELIKYAGNAFLAMKISFINEIADLCERSGTDVQDVARGIGLDTRVGAQFLNAGPGYGGSCLPKDTLAFAQTGRTFNSPLRLVETTIQINETRKRAMAEKVITACGDSVESKTIGVLGLTFKPGTDDMRDAPSITIIQTLVDAGATIRAFDPVGMDAAKTLLPNVSYAADAYTVAEGADCLVLITEWEEFRSLDLDRIRTSMKTPTFIDLRNVFKPTEMAKAGLKYIAIGRGTGKCLN